MMDGNDLPNRSPLAISIGEPAGIGPEIILKAWLARHEEKLPPFAVLGAAAHLSALARDLELEVSVIQADAGSADDVFPEVLPVIPLSGEINVHGRPGNPSEVDAKLVSGSIMAGVRGALEGEFSGIVTAPINKKALYDAGFSFPGHTEFLADLAAQHTGKPCRSVMLLAGPDLKTVPVTIHIPLATVAGALTSELIVETARIVARDLQGRFGISRPRIAVSGLNPHAGENGAMGREDNAIIAPAIEQLQSEGINAFGPLPADTMFHARARKGYDVAVCMYHDQALVPAKTLAFDEAVNVTLGLPFIRTSPDHGTAFDIAGKGLANPSSMIAAIRMAGEMAGYARKTTTAGERDISSGIPV